MSPNDIDACSIWQFQSAADGYRRANMTEEERARELTPDDVDELSEMIGS
ncbi:hypothetical protein [Aureimonas glaciei]|nr:hypothetical protein [Aureimonas glaciei]